MEKMIAICGLDCSKCDAYIATQTDNQELRIKTAKLWAELNNASHNPAALENLKSLRHNK